MLREGTFGRGVHGIVEYVMGAIFIVAPFVLSFDSSAAIASAIVVGVVLFALAASTEGPTSLANILRVQVHVVVDYLLGVFLIAAPFLFGFSGEGAPTAFFIAFGVLHLLITIGTRFARPERSRPRET